MIRQVDNGNNDYINLLTQGQQKTGNAGQIDDVALILGSNNADSASTDASADGYDDQVELSPQALKMLQQYQEANQIAPQANQAADASNSDRVAYLKKLIQNGGVAEYLNGIDNTTLAESLLKHPLAPNLS